MHGMILKPILIPHSTVNDNFCPFSGNLHHPDWSMLHYTDRRGGATRAPLESVHAIMWSYLVPVPVSFVETQ